MVSQTHYLSDTNSKAWRQLELNENDSATIYMDKQADTTPVLNLNLPARKKILQESSYKE